MNKKQVFVFKYVKDGLGMKNHPKIFSHDNRLIIGMKFSAAIILLIALVLTACHSNDSGMKQPPVPDTTGTAVWNYIQQQNYQASWKLWPGSKEYYKGGQLGPQPPKHAPLLTTYLNDIAYSAAQNKTTPFPEGSIIVKENYKPDSTYVTTTVMYKVKGYNSDHSDWFWLKDSTGVIQAEGKVASCISCHSAADKDYLFTLQRTDF